ncbi:MAG: DNA internalization-related competence protein ComEC/Rec2 [Anaerostipes sp.]|jgi:competence protein ComEC
MNQRPLFALFAGCWLGEAILHIHWMVILTTLFLLCVFLIIKRKHGGKKGVFLFLVGMIIGEMAASFYVGQISNQEKKYKEESLQSLIGKVKWKGTTKSGYYYLMENNYDVNQNRYLNGDILIYMDKEDNVAIGNSILYKGELGCFKEPSNLGEFSLKRYYYAKDIYFQMFPDTLEIIQKKESYMAGMIDKGRNFFYNQNEKNYHGETRQIMEAMILGDKSNLTFETKDLFQACGLLHVLAISGLHVSLIGAGIFRKMRNLGAGFWFSFFFCLGIVTAFCQMTGNSISGLRATIMLCIYMFGQCMGKSYDLLTGLAGAGLLLLIQCPERALDSSFIYSAMAVIIIGISQNILKRNPKGIKERIINNFFFCILIQVGMLPITLYFQYEFYLHSFLSNFLLLPLISIGFSMAVITLLIPIPPLIWLCQTIFDIILQIIGWMSRFDGFRIVTGYIPIFYTVLLYLLLVLLWKRKEKKIYAGLFFVFMCIPCFIPRNRLSFLDVGQGDGIVLTQNNQSILIDGGSSTKKNVGRYVLLPYLKYSKVKKIDYAILTHTDSDHDSGMLELLQMGYIRHLILGDVSKDEDYDEIKQMAKEQGTTISYQGKGDVMNANEWKMKCIHPEKGTTLEKNEASLVYQLNIWNTSILLTGDVEKEGEKQVIGQDLEPVDILKVAHHGSKFTTSDELLEKIKPSIGIISAGKDNRYGHPHKELIQRLEEYKLQILDTRTSGMIWITKSKKGVEIHSKKG